MTIADVHTYIQAITVEHGGDDEYQHRTEDTMHVEFIRWIAEEGTPEQKKLAKAVLTVRDIKFSRWCA